ncbi:hypothetical protein DFP72DRAFT_853767 [Ephemerocybe angulata]|uniref:Uncharacterized protein n=1 Tax=Ephemerocybe angulata TaxID=980116 RepID=A0A8H6HJC8_9AGAR|nr:hypothetical protein DFP72DRAFT_853767 [Tulosesus angulatus]
MPAPIATDPNLDVCPDYAAPELEAMRQAVKEGSVDITDERAADILRRSWMANNAIEKAAWAQRVAMEEAAAAEHEREERIERERRAAIELEEAEAVAKEERKKNRAMHLPILEGVGLPDRPLVTVAANIMKDYRQMKYVYLWHHTDKALQAVEFGAATVESETLEQVVTDGVPGLVPAHILKTAKALIKDEDLQFWEYGVASQRSLAAMQEAGWRPEVIAMFGRFHGAIQTHQWASSFDKTGCDRKALLIYQSEMRQRWFLEANKPGGTMFDISVLNDAALSRAQTQAQKLNYATMISGMKQQSGLGSLPFWQEQPLVPRFIQGRLPRS